LVRNWARNNAGLEFLALEGKGGEVGAVGTTLPELPDVWAAVGTGDLPAPLVAAFESGNWAAVRVQLSTVMDGAITDGVYGRQLLQFVMSLPPGVDAVFDRYRAAAMLDHGDWDGIRSAASQLKIEPRALRGLRDILTAALEQESLPPYQEEHEKNLFEIYEYESRRAMGPLRHWVQRVSGRFPKELWAREDVAMGRHLRYRQLQDTTLLAVSESQAGRLEVAHALASEARRMGDPGEPIQSLAEDLVGLTRLGMGDRADFDLSVPIRICQPTGPSPLGCWELLVYELPLLALRQDDSVSWSARLAGYIGARIASPRWQLQAEAWRVADELRSGTPGNRTELAGLVARTRHATPGLKALPTFLQGFSQRRYDVLEEAERLARRSGNVWLQISALSWMTALDPRVRPAKRLRQLLEITGWRRLVLVPSEIAADAALGMTSMGERSEAILELALTADRPNVTTELIAKYIDDPKTPAKTRLSAVNALGRVGTTHAREILSRLAQRRDEVGRAASKTTEGPAYGLSEREIEVLSLAADGRTNKQIGEKLFLSQHTVARHLANARGKLGASNRAEAAVLLRRSAS
jgi:DNA-binding CsgD family transcriptional regulator